MRWLIAIALVGCSGGSTAKPQSPSNTATDNCAVAVNKVFAMFAREGRGDPEPGAKERVIEECRKTPNDPLASCVVAAADDAAINKCMMPKPKGEPGDQLDAATLQLRTYFFIHETFTDEKIALTPAQPCCQFPSKKCPPETAPPEYLVNVLGLDFTKERAFQYRFESTGRKAVIEAIGDRDCDGKTVRYRRELEQRDDGNMHITIDDPKPDAD
jgi:hypothetical protein